MPSTSVPWASSSRARAPPKRPRPMTTTESASAGRSPLRENMFLTNEGPFLRGFIQNRAFPQSKRRAQRGRAEAPDEHQQNQDQLPGRRQGRGDPGGESRRRKRRHNLEQDAFLAKVRDEHQEHC